MAADALPALSPSVAGPLRLALRIGLLVLVVILAVVALRSLPGLQEVRARLGHADLGWLGIGVLLQVASCLAFVVVFRAVFSRRLPVRHAYDLGMAVQAANVLVPAGGASGLALGAWSLRRTGMAEDGIARRTVAFFLLTSSVNFLVAIAAGIALAIGLSATDAPLALTLGPALLSATAVLGVLALAPRLARAQAPEGAGRIRRGAARAAAETGGGVVEARALVRAGDRAVLLGAAGYMLLDVAALAAAFAAVGELPSAGALLLGYVLGQLGSLLPMPGGIGGADSGLIAALVLYGAPLGTAAAAVIAYRAFQLGLPAVLGGMALLRMGGGRAPIREAAAPAMCG